MPTAKECLQAEPSRYQDEHGAWLPVSQVAGLLTTGKMIPNPTPPSQIPIPMTTTRLLELLKKHVSQGNQNKIFGKSLADIESMAERARENDVQGVINWGQILVAKGDLYADELVALVADATSTIPDPDWPTEVADVPPMLTVSEEEAQQAINEIGA